MNRYGLKRDVTALIAEKAQKLSLNKVVLFGSRVRGDFSAKSDIDLAISGATIHSFEASFEEDCPTLLSFDFVNLMDDIDGSLRNGIDAEGVVLYEQI